MKFYDASKELPKSSCDCVVITKSGYISHMPYSVVYKKFNVHDYNEPEEVARYSIEVVCWKPLQEFLQEVEYV